MRRLALLAIASAIAAAVLVVVSPGGSAQQPGERTLVFKETSKGEVFRFVDNPPKSHARNPNRASVSAGDLFAFGNNLLDAQKRRAGRVEGTCTAVRAGRSFDRATFDCHATARLMGGTVSIGANLNFRRDRNVVTGAIEGGTGAYDQARGFFTSKGEPATDTFHVLP